MSVPLRRTPSNRPRRKPLSTEQWLDDFLADNTSGEPVSNQRFMGAAGAAAAKVAEATSKPVCKHFVAIWTLLEQEGWRAVKLPPERTPYSAAVSDSAAEEKTG